MSLQVWKDTGFVETTMYLHSDGSASASVATHNPLRSIQVSVARDGTVTVDVATDSIAVLPLRGEMLAEFVDSVSVLVPLADIETYRALKEAVEHALD